MTSFLIYFLYFMKNLIKMSDIEEDVKVNENDVLNRDADNLSTEVNPNLVMSKNQLKKQKKMQWRLERRVEKRKQERLNKKEKRKALQEAGLPLPRRVRGKHMKFLECSELKIIIDVDFVDVMSDNDIRMVLNQVKSCYAANRKLEHPCQLHVTSFSGKIKNMFQTLQPGYTNWTKISLSENNYLDVSEKENLIYLTSDSENILSEMDEQKSFVIGGLVDHNQHKSICYNRAVSNGIKHARLPIDEFVKLNSRKVLTINHVFEILTHYYVCKDWKEAFFKVIPKRKVVSLIEFNSIQGEKTEINEHKEA